MIDSPANQVTFKRNQMESALWQCLTDGGNENIQPSRRFQTRTKRLIDLDRVSPLDDGSDKLPPAYAFIDSPPQGKGTETSFTSFNGFMLGIGLDLLDCGYKQSEIVFLLRHIRPGLEKVYHEILRTPPSPRQKVLAKHHPGHPSYLENGTRYADLRVYLLIERVELSNVYTQPKNPTPAHPEIPAPVVCYGITQLHDELHKMNYDYRKVLVMEIAEMAVLLLDALQNTPPIHRGRK
ncbi:MAG: hypothetical protein HOL61_05970 [Rhodospirillaceae bacterium]|jgi:hypothetical protein|nr:hypothetical protein [Rhodospirillaceae bacterium]